MDFSALLGQATRSVLGMGGPVLCDTSIGRFQVTGIFDAAFLLLDAGRAGVESSGPAVFLQLADLPVDPEEEQAMRLTVNGTDYRVKGAKKDGVGGVVLLLFEA